MQQYVIAMEIVINWITLSDARPILSLLLDS